jgi:hypothetical protein
MGEAKYRSEKKGGSRNESKRVVSQRLEGVRNNLTDQCRSTHTPKDTSMGLKIAL